MECNKEDAIKAKKMSEKKLAEKDIFGAQRFALKAQNLFADLDGLPKLLEVINVYMNSLKSINGEIDWYSVLGVDSKVDDETLRKHYLKMVLAVHPDKNNSTGADGAFRILSQAWNLLSDKDKRARYDERISVRKVVDGNPSMATSARPPFPQERSNTFWTLCTRCSMNFEYLIKYLNNHLICSNCRAHFLAIEVPAPNQTSSVLFGQSNASQRGHFPPPRGKTPMQSSLGSRSWTNIHPNPSNSKGVSMPSSGAKFHPTGESLKTGCVGADANTSEKQGGSIKKRGRTSQMAAKSGSSSQANASKSLKELSQAGTRKLLMGKAVLEIQKKLDEWNLEKPENTLPKEKKPTAIATATAALDSSNLPQRKKCSVSAAAKVQSVSAKDKSKDVGILTMSVPDPDFHVFDNDRIESSFAEGQVWAAYDDDDGMPRFYAVIKKVAASKRSFKIAINWLNSKTNDELGPLKWVENGFYKTCGAFKRSKSDHNKSLNTFSHKVDKYTKCPNEEIQIFPCKGDVWALFSNWSPEWNPLTPESMIHKYEMVQVLEDFSIENQVIRVVPLIKVPGYTSVFKLNLNPNKILSIPKEEIFRFSHQVPAYVLTGEEAPNAPRGFLELDTAALPKELLQVITEEAKEEAEEDQSTENEKKPSETDTKNETKENETEGVASRPFRTYSRKRLRKKAVEETSEASGGGAETEPHLQ